MSEWQRLFGLDAQLLFDAAVLAVNIFILFLILSYILFNPVRDFLKKRQDKISEDIDNAALAKKEALELKAMYEDKIKTADQEASNILIEARQKAAKSEEKALIAAKEEAARIIKHGNDQIELEYQKAADEMKKQIADVAIEVAKKAVAGTIDEKANKELIDKALLEMDGDTWQN